MGFCISSAISEDISTDFCLFLLRFAEKGFQNLNIFLRNMSKYRDQKGTYGNIGGIVGELIWSRNYLKWK